MIETCLAFSLSESFEFKALTEFCKVHFHARSFREVIAVNFQEQEFHIFEFGVVVFWGQNGYNPELFFSQIKKYFNNPQAEKTFDLFKVTEIGESDKEFKIKRDELQINPNDPLLRVAISFSMAQSVKLGEMEEYVLKEIDLHANIPQDLATHGAIKLSREEMAKIRGRIFVTESRINLKYDLLDKPDFLWDHPEYDDHYNRTSEYLEVNLRINVLNKKLSVLQDILNILADELQFKHSNKLEWIIIILIAFEIVMTIGQGIFDYIKSLH